MHLMDPQLTSSQQAFWSTLAQVNAAIIIALVVEVGVAVRRPVSDPQTVLKLLGAFWRVVTAVAYVIGAVEALAGTLSALGVLQVGKLPNAAKADAAIVSTLVALVVVVGIPLLQFLIWWFRFNGAMVLGTAKDVSDTLQSRRESRKSGKSQQKRAL